MTTPPTPPPGTNWLTYLVVGTVGLGALGFLFLLFGELFLLAIVVFALIAGVGCLHYLLWGRSMSQDANKHRAKAASTTTEGE